MKKKLSSGEIDSYASDIYKVLRDVPLFYLTEVLELASEGRMRDGDDPDLDVSSDEESSDEEPEPETTEDEEESSEGSSEEDD
tara:strand:- start:2056 stop:2304 length:249 start_codon:yes stop_codon:yes gene_type:complete